MKREMWKNATRRLNPKTSVIHRKGAKSAKVAKKIKDLTEVFEHFVIHPLGELTELHKLFLPLRSLYLCAFAVKI